MMYLGSAITWIGVLWLAWFGIATWDTNPPEMIGLPMGQVLVGIAVVIGLGQVLTVIAERPALRRGSRG